MSKILFLIFSGVVCTVLVCCNRQKTARPEKNGEDDAVAVVPSVGQVKGETMPPGVKALFRAYPHSITGYRNGMLLFSNGDSLRYDDGKKKDFVTKLDHSDPEDMFSMVYDTISAVPAYLADAGRSRCEALFRKMYGNSKDEVTHRLVTVQWFGQKIRFTSVNGAADSLRKVAAELADKPHLRSYLTGASTVYWRKVRGADRLSAHSYGIAIDINTARSDYWLWSNPGKEETAKISYENRIPLEIVKTFERHGFIWGGRWYHYDTMHFEYRPEFYHIAR